MARFTTGMHAPDFSYATPFQTGLTFRETAGKARKTGLVFLRYYGCVLCQYDMHQFAASYERFTAGGGQLLVVLQSAPEHLAEQLRKDSYPFDIICDPQQVLYRMFDIRPAGSRRKLGGESTLKKRAAAIEAGFLHGDYEGEELQLPAAFVVTPDLEITYAHYGTSADDVPTPGELLEELS